ncbi:XdhC family protein [Nocardia sp. NEAU-G5]|uniref:XdhC family protein n=1 Tax=Nocardia albiluteola TaxID=2842303 RepID=A0ABS6B1X5_9NOCA|nr:XdhC family protein [Nocardia albiluteola]
MRDILAELTSIWRSGGTAGVATVVRTPGSSPRPVGAVMMVAPDGVVAGSASGGCVEAAVYELANEVVRDGRPQLRSYGLSTDDPFAVGLTCGGENLLSDPAARYQDLGPDYHDRRLNTDRRIRNHIAQLTALAYQPGSAGRCRLPAHHVIFRLGPPKGGPR